MKRFNQFFTILLIITAVLPVLSGCEEKEEVFGDIELPPAPIVSTSESWAVINSAYLRLREMPASEAGIVTTLWRGYILEVMSRSPAKSVVDDEEDYWYQVNYDGLQGWVFGSYLDIFDTREQASVKARAVRND